MKQPVNEKSSWQQGVDELEYMEEGVDPVNPRSWNIIRKNLNKEKKKSGSWYWIAAAISGIILTLWIGGRMRQQPASINDNHTNKVVNTSQKAVVNPGINKDSLKSLPAVDNIVVKKHHNNIKTVVGINQTIPLKNSDTVLAPEIVNYIPPNSKEKKDTIAVVKAIPKKALGMSHINDYAETIESTPGVTMKVQPLRRFIRGTRDESVENAATASPVKPHNIIKPSTIQN